MARSKVSSARISAPRQVLPLRQLLRHVRSYVCKRRHLACQWVSRQLPLPLVSAAIHSRLSRAYPGVSLTLWEGFSNEVVARFAKDEMDVAFVRAAHLHAEGLQITPLLDEPMVAALPSEHPMAQRQKGKAVPLAQLAGDPFIIIGPPGTGIHDETLAACRNAGFSPRIGQQAPRITSTLGLVATGLDVAIVPESMQRMTMNGVVFRRLSGAQPKAFLGLAWRRADTSPLVPQFLGTVNKVARRRLAAWQV